MSLKTSFAGIIFAIICMAGSGIWAASALMSDVNRLSSQTTDLQIRFGATQLKAELTEQRVMRMESDISEIKRDVKEVVRLAKQ